LSQWPFVLWPFVCGLLSSGLLSRGLLSSILQLLTRAFHVKMRIGENKKLCCRREAARCFARMAWLPDSEKILKICFFVLTECTNVTDRHTQRQTDTAWRLMPRLMLASTARQKWRRRFNFCHKQDSLMRGDRRHCLLW